METLMYIKTPTFLYHADLAPKGRVFEGTTDRPLPHPGEGWLDAPGDWVSPEPLTADAVVAAHAAASDATAAIERLTEERADALARAESAEASAEALKAGLTAETEAHASTRAKLETAGDDLRAMDLKLQEAAPELARIPGLVEQLETANGLLSDQGAEVNKLKEYIQEYETDVANLRAKIEALEVEGKAGARRAKPDA